MVFYADLAFFMVRDLLSSAAMTSAYIAPLIVTLPVAGIQCACFNGEQDGIFILDSSGAILFYDVGTNELNILGQTSYTGITDCYYDHPSSEMALVWQGSDIKYFDLTSFTEASFHSSN